MRHACPSRMIFADTNLIYGASIYVVLKLGARYGKRSAERQSGGQEAEEGEGQGHSRRAEPKSGGVAAELRCRQEEIETVGPHLEEHRFPILSGVENLRVA